MNIKSVLLAGLMTLCCIANSQPIDPRVPPRTFDPDLVRDFHQLILKNHGQAWRSCVVGAKKERERWGSDLFDLYVNLSKTQSSLDEATKIKAVVMTSSDWYATTACLTRAHLLYMTAYDQGAVATWRYNTISNILSGGELTQKGKNWVDERLSLSERGQFEAATRSATRPLKEVLAQYAAERRNREETKKALGAQYFARKDDFDERQELFSKDIGRGFEALNCTKVDDLTQDQMLAGIQAVACH